MTFDDPGLVADAGLLLPATLAVRLGLEALIDATVRLGDRAGAASPGRKVLTLVFSILAGGSHIDHADRLRAGATARVLPFRVMAPSTLGTFLRAFTFGHVRQLDKTIAETIRRAWQTGIGPAAGPVVIDMDSTICEVHGHQKEGAAYGYTRVLGYHPLLATRAETGEVLHARMRKGSSQRGHNRFVEELIARVRRAGATGPLRLRADAGFWSYKIIDTLTRLSVDWSITVRINPSIRKAIDGISEDAWTTIVYPDKGIGQVADTTYTTGKGTKAERTMRLVVRRTRLTGKREQTLWPDWRHHAFITNLTSGVVEVDEFHRDHARVAVELVDLTSGVVEVDEFHRDHARVELAIRDLKEGAGMNHCPSGRFYANAAWLACAVLAHNLVRWTARLGGLHPAGELTVARTIRQRILGLPGRVVNRSGHHVLRLPERWPWATRFTTALDKIRNLPLLA